MQKIKTKQISYDKLCKKAKQNKKQMNLTNSKKKCDSYINTPNLLQPFERQGLSG